MTGKTGQREFKFNFTLKITQKFDSCKENAIFFERDK